MNSKFEKRRKHDNLINITNNIYLGIYYNLCHFFISNTLVEVNYLSFDKIG